MTDLSDFLPIHPDATVTFHGSCDFRSLKLLYGMFAWYPPTTDNVVHTISARTLRRLLGVDTISQRQTRDILRTLFGLSLHVSSPTDSPDHISFQATTLFLSSRLTTHSPTSSENLDDQDTLSWKYNSMLTQILATIPATFTKPDEHFRTDA